MDPLESRKNFYAPLIDYAYMQYMNAEGPLSTSFTTTRGNEPVIAQASTPPPPNVKGVRFGTTTIDTAAEKAVLFDSLHPVDKTLRFEDLPPATDKSDVFDSIPVNKSPVNKADRFNEQFPTTPPADTNGGAITDTTPTSVPMGVKIAVIAIPLVVLIAIGVARAKKS